VGYLAYARDRPCIGLDKRKVHFGYEIRALEDSWVPSSSARPDQAIALVNAILEALVVLDNISLIQSLALRKLYQWVQSRACICFKHLLGKIKTSKKYAFLYGRLRMETWWELDKPAINFQRSSLYTNQYVLEKNQIRILITGERSISRKKIHPKARNDKLFRGTSLISIRHTEEESRAWHEANMGENQLDVQKNHQLT
ncbi:hypothetical protein IGI04_005730, partial [Brassica rapa subsp. trilocularis]